MEYLTREMIFGTAKKGNRLTINPDSLTAETFEVFDYETGKELYVVAFNVKSIGGQSMNSTFVEFNLDMNGLEQANKLVKRILG